MGGQVEHVLGLAAIALPASAPGPPESADPARHLGLVLAARGGEDVIAQRGPCRLGSRGGAV